MKKAQTEGNESHLAKCDETANPMTQDEIDSLEGFERVIEKNLSAFYEVGAALLAIRNNRLYRSHFPTFEDYCRERWEMGRHNAYRQMNAAEVMSKLLTMVNVELPKTERQIRSLVGLEPDVTRSIWAEAVQTSGEKPVTGKLVTALVNAVRPKAFWKRANTQEKESWQAWIEPLLKQALAEAKIGNRDRVQELLYKASLRIEVGMNTFAKDA